MQNFFPAAFSKVQLEQRIGLPTEATTDSLLYHAPASKGIANQASRKWPIQLVFGRARLYLLLYGEVEKQMSHGLLGPLETVDFHDPLAPLQDGSRPLVALKGFNSLKKPKGINRFSDENSTLSRSPKAPKNLDAGYSISGFLAKLTPGCFTLNLHRRSGRAARGSGLRKDDGNTFHCGGCTRRTSSRAECSAICRWSSACLTTIHDLALGEWRSARASIPFTP